MNLKGTKSESNVKAALTGESLARNKYTFYAMQARTEGNEELAELFEKMAKNETSHAKIWFNILNNGLGNSLDNLKDAAEGENSEWTSMYPNFAKVAREEGLEELAVMFEKVAEIESDHERRFLKAFLDLKRKNNNEKPDEKKEKLEHGYYCMFCGAKFDKRPDVCPVCGAIGSFEYSEF